MKQLFDSFKSTSLDVLPNLKERYGLLLRHDLVSVKLMQKEGQILLEFTVTDKDHYSFDNKNISLIRLLFLIPKRNDLLMSYYLLM